MTITAKPLFEVTAVPAAETTMYAAPVSTRAIIDKFTAANTTAAPITLTIKLVPSGGAAGAGNVVVPPVTIAAGAVYTGPEIIGHLLAAGDFISLLPSAVGLNCRASGREIV